MVYELGILQHVLQCLANSSHEAPRIDTTTEGGGVKDDSTSHFKRCVHHLLSTKHFFLQ